MQKEFKMICINLSVSTFIGEITLNIKKQVGITILDVVFRNYLG